MNSFSHTANKTKIPMFNHGKKALIIGIFSVNRSFPSGCLFCILGIEEANSDLSILLKGGNANEVVRIHNTVRRHTKPWSSSIHDLLLHLESQGFNGAPRFLGTDNKNREILTYISGEVGQYPFKPFIWSDEVLTGMARLLRQFHDATVNYIPPPNAEMDDHLP